MKTALFTLLIFSLLTSGCSNTPRDPTITFTREGCSYSGPDRVSEKFTVQWTVDETVSGTALLMVISADPSLSLEEIASMPASDPPPAGVTKLRWEASMEPGAYSKTIDLAPNAAYQGEPVYLVCFFTDEGTAVGAGGPLEVRR